MYTFEEIGEMTYPQAMCLAHKGNPPAAGRKTFGSMAEAEANRQRELKG